jgi:hypothetical protein
MAERLSLDWLLLTTDLQVVAELPEGAEKYIQDIVICNQDLTTGVKVQIFYEKKTELTIDKPTFDPDLSADYMTEGTIKAGLKLKGDYTLKAKLSGAASNVFIRTLF